MRDDIPDFPSRNQTIDYMRNVFWLEWAHMKENRLFCPSALIVKSLSFFIVLVLVLLAIPLLMPGEGGQQSVAPATGMPWQVERLPDGLSRVFGIVPGQSTLSEARGLLAGAPQVALIVAPGGSGSLEAYYDTISAGLVTGKMILTLATTLEQREQMLQRARKAEYMESTTRRVTLSEADQAWAEGAVIAGITFIPAANLDEQIVLQRFGAPAERIRGDEHREHFLYPELGLDLQLDAKGKEVLQYVAPRDFARLRDPLLAER